MPYFRFLLLIVINPKQNNLMKEKKAVKIVRVLTPPVHIVRKVKAVRLDFDNLVNAEGFKVSVVIDKLSKKYYYAPRTIEDIIYKNGYYKNI